jgi:hypothetical protein
MPATAEQRESGEEWETIRRRCCRNSLRATLQMVAVFGWQPRRCGAWSRGKTDSPQVSVPAAYEYLPSSAHSLRNGTIMSCIPTGLISGGNPVGQLRLERSALTGRTDMHCPRQGFSDKVRVIHIFVLGADHSLLFASLGRASGRWPAWGCNRGNHLRTGLELRSTGTIGRAI